MAQHLSGGQVHSSKIWDMTNSSHLALKFSPFADIFRHFLWFYWATRVQSRPQSAPPSNIGPKPANPFALPRNLYGLQQNIAGEIDITKQYAFATSGMTLTALKRLSEPKFVEEIFDAAESALIKVLQFELLAPHLKAIDQGLTENDNYRRSNTPEDVLNHITTWGAILHAIAQAVGTDAIFASQSICVIALSPTFIHNTAVTNLRNYANFLLGNNGILEVFSQWLVKNLNLEITSVAKALCTTITKFIQQSINSLQLTGGKSQKSNLAKNCAPIFGPVTPSQLVPYHPHHLPNYSFLALIIREALSTKPVEDVWHGF
ncbi:hypothetical protein DFP72DRAFT_1079273 [Ephemerocybe angulata]|uniref:Uncharacterized protein n=1 Tax=Ephemerocybe angulata TaxID=980116 RepID=A0A8H6LV99_9AGAR|nr:hypothetical protein DFP72DRAFT_1079273 [Tulosesus angulatus]